MGTGVGVPGTPRPIPTTGMRGGLGRTLLTAFLILTILPLAFIGGYAVQQNRQNLQEEVESKLLAVATLKGEALRLWIEELRTLLLLSISLDGEIPEQRKGVTWNVLTEQVPDLQGMVVLNEKGQRVWTVGNCGATLPTPQTFSISYPDAVVVLAFPHDEQTLVFCLEGSGLEQVIQSDVAVGETGEVYLVYRSCIWPEGRRCPDPLLAGVLDQRADSGEYVNHLGLPVIGAYYPLPDLEAGILVEQSQAETMVSTDRIAATFIALTLAVALATTAIAAIVVRQITRPVIRLTESAVAMAEGDLEQHLSVTSRDEIGILTYVFNEMAAELKSLYDDLETKVVDRTKMLQQANYQIQRRALHFQASQEVSQAITSIRDPELLLNRVVDLIREHFIYASVAVYLVEPGGGEARLRTISPADGAWPERVYAGHGSVVEQAIRKRCPQVDSHQTPEPVEWYRRTLSRLAVPLRMENRVLGALAVLSTEREGVQEDEVEVLEILANQVAIALENARAYERERLAMQQLEEAEVFKSRFLANMSHELREPLNTIIGFSRLMIKEIDGPLNPQQRQDLERIYSDSQHLLFLINDILAITQIQAGLMELKLQPVSLRDVVKGVMPTASALVRGKDVELVQELPEDLPLLRADPIRLRQILVHLLTNAAKFTHEGSITLRAWFNEGSVYVSIEDTGVGIPPEDRERIFVRFEKAGARNSSRYRGIGLGLALSKEFVEMHGGQIWVESEVGKGSTFTFSIPCYPTQRPAK